MLFLTPTGGSSHTYTDTTTIAVDDPATCVTLIGRAAADALARS